MQKKRIAIIDYKKCKKEECGFACYNICPVIKMNKEAIVYNELEKKVQISEELCTGCGICPKKCPSGAITIINLSLDLSEPIHQYGKNRFRLFRLPTIRAGNAVGLIGKNGIGKSTILNIYSGDIIPNQGNYEKPGNYEEIINYFKGKELQETFINLKNGKTKVSYKPQNIKAIKDNFKGKVIDLLKKVDERKELNKIIDLLKMDNIMNKEISTLSGGELQKVAIAATIIKKANLYFYDEPSSFLDIKQRFVFAKLIEDYKDTNLIVEHDLALVDYLCDYLHILFGKAHAYGVVSNTKTTNTAINEFLDGFIPDENLRFRDYEINFYYRGEQAKKTNLFFNYPQMCKTFKDFKLDVDDGSLNEGEIIGIVGENGIGKTTFVKLLAGVEKEDNEINVFNKRMSYKPQDFDGEHVKVREFLKGVNQEILMSELWFKLKINEIEDLYLDELNMGTLQKIMIAKTLTTDAEIYLLDEPSAFLDVEERINIAKIIQSIIAKRKKVAFVVDHDILFVDFVSDKIIVFDGKPGIEGFCTKPKDKKRGMNQFLKILDVTYRKDLKSGRPRVNKLNSTKDKEQKADGNYYIY